MLTNSCPNFGQPDSKDWNIFDFLEETNQQQNDSKDKGMASIISNEECVQKVLSKSITWNHFFKQKLINMSNELETTVQHLNEEKQNHLALQLAYDQRTREWSQQQEQLICLLLEIQPLRDRVKMAESIAENEKANSLKHESIERSLQISIDQLNAKITFLHSKVNPGFVEGIERKLMESKQKNKKLRIDLADSSIEINNLRTYISTHHVHLENTNKKLLWALKVAMKSNGRKQKLTNNESEELITAYEDVELNLKNQYKSFRNERQQKLAGRKLELTLIPSFEDWLEKQKPVEDSKMEKSLLEMETEIVELENIFNEALPVESEEKPVKKRKKQEPGKLVKRRMSRKENEESTSVNVKNETFSRIKPCSPKFKVPDSKLLKTSPKKRTSSNDSRWETKRRRTLREIGLELSDTSESEFEDDSRTKLPPLGVPSRQDLKKEEEERVASDHELIFPELLLPGEVLSEIKRKQRERDLSMVRNIKREMTISPMQMEEWPSDISDLEDEPLSNRKSCIHRIKRLESTGFVPPPMVEDDVPSEDVQNSDLNGEDDASLVESKDNKSNLNPPMLKNYSATSAEVMEKLQKELLKAIKTSNSWDFSHPNRRRTRSCGLEPTTEIPIELTLSRRKSRTEQKSTEENKEMIKSKRSTSLEVKRMEEAAPRTRRRCKTADHIQMKSEFEEVKRPPLKKTRSRNSLKEVKIEPSCKRSLSKRDKLNGEIDEGKLSKNEDPVVIDAGNLENVKKEASNPRNKEGIEVDTKTFALGRKKKKIAKEVPEEEFISRRTRSRSSGGSETILINNLKEKENLFESKCKQLIKEPTTVVAPSNKRKCGSLRRSGRLNRSAAVTSPKAEINDVETAKTVEQQEISSPESPFEKEINLSSDEDEDLVITDCGPQKSLFGDESPPPPPPSSLVASTPMKSVEDQSFFKEMDISNTSIEEDSPTYASFLLDLNSSPPPPAASLNHENHHYHPPPAPVPIVPENNSAPPISCSIPAVNFYTKKIEKPDCKRSSEPLETVSLPLITTVPSPPVAVEPIEDNYYDEDDCLQPILEELMSLSTFINGFQWNSNMQALKKEILAVKHKSIVPKLQPLVRCMIVNILRIEVLQEISGHVRLKMDEMKCLLEISKQLNRPNMLRDLDRFLIDNLINGALHRLVLQRRLHPASLAAVTCWFLFSMRRQNAVAHDFAMGDRAKAFLIDVCVTHPGLCHQALLVAANTHKFNCGRRKGFRGESLWEEVLLWVIHHGAWSGAPEVKTQLMFVVNRNLSRVDQQPPSEDPNIILEHLLKQLLECQTKDRQCLQALLLVMFNWAPSIIISLKSMIGNLKSETSNAQFSLLIQAISFVYEESLLSKKHKLDFKEIIKILEKS